MRSRHLIPCLIAGLVFVSACGYDLPPGLEKEAIQSALNLSFARQILNASPGWVANATYDYGTYTVVFLQNGEALFAARVSGYDRHAYPTNLSQAGAENVLRARIGKVVQTVQKEVPLNFILHAWETTDGDWTVGLTRDYMLLAKNRTELAGYLKDESSKAISKAPDLQREPLRRYMTALKESLSSGELNASINYAWQILNETTPRTYLTHSPEARYRATWIRNHAFNISKWAPLNESRLEFLGVLSGGGGWASYFKGPADQIYILFYVPGVAYHAAITYGELFRYINEPIPQGYANFTNNTASDPEPELYVERIRVLSPDGNYTESKFSIRQTPVVFPVSPLVSQDVTHAGPFSLNLVYSGGNRNKESASLTAIYLNRSVYSGPASGARIDADGDGVADGYLQLYEFHPTVPGGEQVGLFRWIERDQPQ